MKHELVQARDATGMQLRGQNDLLCGYYRGYAMLTVMNSKNRSYDIAVWASRPGCDMAPQLNQWMADYAARNPVCTAGTYNGQLLTVRVAMDKKRDITAQSLISFYKEVTGWLAANGMVSVCDQCGAADTSLYHIGRGIVRRTHREDPVALKHHLSVFPVNMVPLLGVVPDDKAGLQLCFHNCVLSFPSCGPSSGGGEAYCFSFSASARLYFSIAT